MSSAPRAPFPQRDVITSVEPLSIFPLGVFVLLWFLRWGSHIVTWAGSKLWDSRVFPAFVPSGAGTSGMDHHHTRLFLVWSERKLKTHQVGPAGWLSSQRAYHTSLIIQFHPQKPHSGRERETAPLGRPLTSTSPPKQTYTFTHMSTHTCTQTIYF